MAKPRRRGNGPPASQQQGATGGQIQVTAQGQWFSGPVPAPEVLARYDALVPGTAAKIIAHADAQMNHRIGLENRVIDANIRIEARGQVFAFIIALVVFFLGSFLIYTGKGAYGATIMGVDLATILSMFIVGQRAQTRALRDSANPFRPPVAKSK